MPFVFKSVASLLTTCLKKIGLAAGLTLILCAPAQAQFAGKSKAPVDLIADEIQSEGSTTTLRGQVDVRQGDVRVLADEVQIFGASTGESVSNVTRIVANGNFYYISPEQEVRGDQGIYERATDTFTVTGNVILLQGEDNIVTGNKLFYNVGNKTARMVGNCKGRRCGTTGRVKAMLKSSDAQESSASNNGT